jgi:hypothetical protein
VCRLGQLIDQLQGLACWAALEQASEFGVGVDVRGHELDTKAVRQLPAERQSGARPVAPLDTDDDRPGHCSNPVRVEGLNSSGNDTGPEVSGSRPWLAAVLTDGQRLVAGRFASESRDASRTGSSGSPHIMHVTAPSGTRATVRATLVLFLGQLLPPEQTHGPALLVEGVRGPTLPGVWAHVHA